MIEWSGGDITDPQSLNRYAYVLNNPTTLTDPLGLDPCDRNPNSIACNNGSHFQDVVSHPISCGPGAGWCMPPVGGNFGNDIFDAISGAPGTYLTYGTHGNLGFGFSDELWSETWNLIDSERAAFARSDLDAGLVPTSGYQVVYRDYGVFVRASGLVPDYESLAQERRQLAAMAGNGWLAFYQKGLGAPSAYDLFNQGLQDISLTFTLNVARSLNPGLSTRLAPWIGAYQTSATQLIDYVTVFFSQNLRPGH